MNKEILQVAGSIDEVIRYGHTAPLRITSWERDRRFYGYTTSDNIIWQYYKYNTTPAYSHDALGYTMSSTIEFDPLVVSDDYWRSIDVKVETMYEGTSREDGETILKIVGRRTDRSSNVNKTVLIANWDNGMLQRPFLHYVEKGKKYFVIAMKDGLQFIQRTVQMDNQSYQPTLEMFVLMPDTLATLRNDYTELLSWCNGMLQYGMEATSTL